MDDACSTRVEGRVRLKGASSARVEETTRLLPTRGKGSAVLDGNEEERSSDVSNDDDSMSQQKFFYAVIATSAFVLCVYRLATNFSTYQ